MESLSFKDGDVIGKYLSVLMESNNEREFWYGRINKHPEDCSREEIFRVMGAFGDSRVENCSIPGVRLSCFEEVLEAWSKSDKGMDFAIWINRQIEKHEV